MSIFDTAYCPPTRDYRNWNYAVGTLIVKTFNSEYSFRVEGGAWITRITMTGSTNGRHEACKGFYATFTKDMSTAINACMYECVDPDFSNLWGTRLVMKFRKSDHLDAPMRDGDFDLITSPIRSITLTVS
jgi:hypothetical protein